MANLADLSDIVNRLTGGNSGTPEFRNFYKDARVGAAAAAATIAGRETSLWEYNGNPSHGAAPGAVAVPVNTTAGGLIQTDPGGGRQKWLVGGWASSLAAGQLVIYDRLRHISGLSGTTTTAQTTNGTAITRYTNGQGNEIWVEIYTQIGATGTTATCAYNDQDNNSATSPAFAIGATGFREAQRIIRVPLDSGDYGVRDVSNIDLVASTATAGNFGVNLVHPLATISIPATGTAGLLKPFVFPVGPIEVLTDACIAMSWIANGTTAPQIWGCLVFIEA